MISYASISYFIFIELSTSLAGTIVGISSGEPQPGGILLDCWK